MKNVKEIHKINDLKGFIMLRDGHEIVIANNRTAIAHHPSKNFLFC